MTTTIEVRNFQAIERASFKIEGLTVVVGRSNIGKSALVRALQCALTGAEGSDFVRHDPKTCSRIQRGTKKCQCSASVRIEFPDGNVVLWEKGDAINQYTTWVDGDKQVYSRVGRSPELPPALAGFEPISVGDKSKQYLQISNQFTPIFLLNLPGSAVADLLSDVAQLDEINGAMRLVTKDRKAAASKRKVRDADVLDLEKGLQKYAGLDQRAKDVQAIERTLLAYQKLELSLDKVRGFIEGVSGAAQVIKSWAAALAPALPDAGSLGTKSDRLGRVASWITQVQTVQSAYKALKEATRFTVPDLGQLGSLGGRYEAVVGYYEAVRARVTVIKSLRGVDELVVPEVEPLKDRRDRLVQASALGKRWSFYDGFLAQTERFDAIELSDAKLQQARELLTSLEDLDRFSDRLGTSISRIEGLEGDLVEAESALDEVEAEFADLGVCPTCSQPIKPGQLCEEDVA